MGCWLELQGLGLGKALVEQMVRSLLRRGISNITLFADANGATTRKIVYCPSTAARRVCAEYTAAQMLDSNMDASRMSSFDATRCILPSFCLNSNGRDSTKGIL